MIRLQTLLPESFSKYSKIQRELEEKYSKVIDRLWIFQHESPVKHLEVNVIKIKNEFKNQGWGSKIMSDICEFADDTNQITALTPNDTYGSDVTKLKAFYKKFNFEPNRGNRAIHSISDSMIRLPKSN